MYSSLCKPLNMYHVSVYEKNNLEKTIQRRNILQNYSRFSNAPVVEKFWTNKFNLILEH